MLNLTQIYPVAA